MGKQSLWQSAMTYIAMISLQLGYSGMHVIVLLSLKKGFSHWVFVVYRHAVATMVFAPFAFFFERKVRPKLTKMTFLKIMGLALLEPVIDQNLYGVALQYTSAAFAAAMMNVLPAITFILAVIFRMEKVNLKKAYSLAMVIGTVLTASGAMVMTLFKGPAFNIFPHSHAFSLHAAAGEASRSHWIPGTIMMLGTVTGWAGFFILQKNTLKDYPAEMSLTALVCLMGTVEGGAVAVVMERRPSAWAIGFDTRLLAATYSGIICSGIAYYLQSVVNRSRGPVFVTAFSPLSMILTAVLGAIVLAEKIYLGSLIGAFIIVFGLYSVVWGKSKQKSDSEVLPIMVENKNSAEAPGKETVEMKGNNDLQP